MLDFVHTVSVVCYNQCDKDLKFFQTLLWLIHKPSVANITSNYKDNFNCTWGHFTLELEGP